MSEADPRRRRAILGAPYVLNPAAPSNVATVDLCTVEGTGWTDAEPVGFGPKAVELGSEEAGVSGTPSIKVNGTVLDLATPSQQPLADQVKAATK